MLEQKGFEPAVRFRDLSCSLRLRTTLGLSYCRGDTLRAARRDFQSRLRGGNTEMQLLLKLRVFEPRVCPAVEPPAGCEESSARPLCTVRKIAESSAPFGIDGRLRAVLTETGLRWRVELSVSCRS